MTLTIRDIGTCLCPANILWAFCIAVLCLLSMPAAARARCGLPDEVMRLVSDLYAFSSQGEAQGTRLSDRIRRDIQGIDMRDVNSKLFAVGLAESRSRIDALLHQAQNVGASGQISSPHLLRERLNSVERLHNAVCKLEEINAAQVPKSRPDSHAGDLSQMIERFGTTARMALLLGLTGVLIGLVLLVRLLYDWVYARVSNRRVCRINGAIEQELDVIDGTVTILGTRGCRFQPVNKGAFARAEQMAEKEGVFLVLNGKRFLIGTCVLQEHFLTLLFQRPMTRAAQEALLGLSTITPRFVPKSPNIRKRMRQRIARREARQK